MKNKEQRDHPFPLLAQPLSTSPQFFLAPGVLLRSLVRSPPENGKETAVTPANLNSTQQSKSLQHTALPRTAVPYLSPSVCFQYVIRDKMLLMKSSVVITVVIVFFFLHSFVHDLYLGVGECVAIYCSLSSRYMRYIFKQ